MSVPHPARIHDWLLDGRHHFEVDRKAGEHILASYPGGVEGARSSARSSRRFLVETVTYLAGPAGGRQFLDIGTGIPNDDNVHAVAQRTAADSRIVYVDHDPIVLANAHELLHSTAEGATQFLQADLRDPELILDKAAHTLDFTKPVTVMLVGILHFIADEEDPYGIVARLMDAMTPGSHLVLSHMTGDIMPEEMAEMAARTGSELKAGGVWRSHAEVSRFFDGLEMLEPGLVPINQWRQEPPPNGPVIPIYGGVGRKPE